VKKKGKGMTFNIYTPTEWNEKKKKKEKIE